MTSSFTIDQTEGVLAEIHEERRHQVSVENFDTSHDDDHHPGELAYAAACYAASAVSFMRGQIPLTLLRQDKLYQKIWPWQPEYWKPKDARRDLIRAGALIVAEIERLDRNPPRGNAA